MKALFYYISDKTGISHTLLSQNEYKYKKHKYVFISSNQNKTIKEVNLRKRDYTLNYFTDYCKSQLRKVILYALLVY